MEVHRTCQFAVTVLTPATTGNGGSTYRFDIFNIHLLLAFWQGEKEIFIIFQAKLKSETFFRRSLFTLATAAASRRDSIIAA